MHFFRCCIKIVAALVGDLCVVGKTALGTFCILINPLYTNRIFLHFDNILKSGWVIVYREQGLIDRLTFYACSESNEIGHTKYML